MKYLITAFLLFIGLSTFSQNYVNVAQPQNFYGPVKIGDSAVINYTLLSTDSSKKAVSSAWVKQLLAGFTPFISATGVLKGTGSSVVSATHGTDYYSPLDTTSTLLTQHNAAQTYQPIISNPTISGISLGNSLYQLNWGWGFTSSTPYNGSGTVTQNLDSTKIIPLIDSNRLYVTPYQAGQTYQYKGDSTKISKYFTTRVQVNIIDWGAVGNGSTDNTTVIRNAVSYLSSLGGGTLNIPYGNFIVSDTIAIPANIRVLGEGMGASIITQTASNKSLFCVTGNNVCFDNLRISCSSTSVTAGAGITTYSFQNSRIFNCWIQNFYVNVNIVQGFQWVMHNVFFVGCAYVDLIGQNLGAGDAGDNCISDCFFYPPSSNYTSAEASIQLYSSGGLKIINTKFNDNSSNTYAFYNHIEVLYNLATSILLISNCSFENYKHNAIYFNPSASFGKVIITGNHFDGNSLSSQDTAIAIVSSNTGRTFINGNLFYNVSCGVYNSAGSGVDIGLNDWYSVTTKTAGSGTYISPEFAGNLIVDGSVTASTLTANIWSSASGTMTISPSGTAAVDVSSAGIFPASNATFNSGTSANNWLITYSNQLLSNSSLIVGTVNSNSISMQVGGLQGLRVSASTADVNVGYNIGTVDMNAALGVRGRYNSIGNAAIIQDSAGVNLFQVYNAGMVVVGTASSGTNPFQVNSGPASFAYGIYNNAAVTTVSGSTSGTAVFCEKEMGSGGKEVDIYFANLNGTASFTFPVAFTYTPGFFPGSTLSSSNLSSISTTSVTVTGTGGTGVAILKGL